MRKTFLLSVLVFVVFTGNAQEEVIDQNIGNSKATNLFAEAFGNGLFLSLNYDFRFKQQQDGLGMRIGLGFFDGGSSNGVATIPIAINYLIGRSTGFLELSFGATYATFDDDFRSFFFYYPSKVLIVPGIGYRYQPKGKGLIGRIGFAPLISTNGRSIPFGGLSVGYKF